jgi:hypothetical protein
MGATYKSSGSWSNYPKGCQLSAGKKVYFNKHATGSAKPGEAPVCQRENVAGVYTEIQKPEVINTHVAEAGHAKIMDGGQQDLISPTTASQDSISASPVEALAAGAGRKLLEKSKATTGAGNPLDLTGALVKEGPTTHYDGATAAVDGVVSASNLAWSQCKQYTTGSNPWWGVDLGSNMKVTKVKLYNRNDCCADRLESVSIYLGNSWDSYSSNAVVASGVDVPGSSPLEVNINANGRYLFVARPGSDKMTLCEIQVWADFCTNTITLGNDESLATDTLAKMKSMWDTSCDNMEGKDKENIKGQFRNGQPVYGAVVKESSSAGGTCILKYGWGATRDSNYKMTILAYHKIACTDDGIKYVSRKLLLRAWNDIPGMKPGGVCNWCNCIGSYDVAACTSIAGETWSEATQDDVKHDFSIQ